MSRQHVIKCVNVDNKYYTCKLHVRVVALRYHNFAIMLAPDDSYKKNINTIRLAPDRATKTEHEEEIR